MGLSKTSSNPPPIAYTTMARHRPKYGDGNTNGIPDRSACADGRRMGVQIVGAARIRFMQ
jgi:hypothetical protein